MIEQLWPDPDRREAAVARLWERAGLQERDLTDIERDYLLAASMGMSITDTAKLFGVCRGTVDGALFRARRVLAAKNTAHAVALALRNGLIE